MSTGSGKWRSRPSITALVTTFNEERNIQACLDSLSWCDEIVVVDSYSGDRTPEIARRHPKVVFKQHEYFGGAAQKNWSIPLAQCEWILLLDADERCTPELRREIEDRLAGNGDFNAYTIRRRGYFLGQRIRFCGWHKECVVRLFRRGRAGYQNKRVHAQMITDGEAPLLTHPFEHYMVQDLGEYAGRVSRYGVWGAAQGWIDGKRATVLAVVVRPLWRFLRTYVLLGGFLDGVNGFLFCAFQAQGTFIKWSVLRSWRVQARRGESPRLPDFDESPQTWAVVPGAAGHDRERTKAASR
jgi:glycosyltransferase involved in cell wall biosynthesis